MCPLPLEPPLHPTHIPPPGRHRQHHCELPAVCNNFPLAIYFTYGSVYVSMLLSQFAHTLLSPLLKIFIEFVTILLLCYVFVFWS